MNTVFPRGVVFDWDNTLVDNWPVIATAINDTFREFGKPQWTLDEVKQHCNRAARDSFPEWFGAQWKAAHDFFYNRFEAIHLTMLTRLAGAEELLDYIHATGTPAFVVSNKRGIYLRQQADALNWTRYFVAVVGSQDAARDKPMRDPVDLALAKASLTADTSIWFVGDTLIDMQCAQNAGCLPVFIGNAQTLGDFTPALSFSNCQKLETLLKSLRNKEKI